MSAPVRGDADERSADAYENARTRSPSCTEQRGALSLCGGAATGRLVPPPRRPRTLFDSAAHFCGCPSAHVRAALVRNRATARTERFFGLVAAVAPAQVLRGGRAESRRDQTAHVQPRARVAEEVRRRRGEPARGPPRAYAARRISSRRRVDDVAAHMADTAAELEGVNERKQKVLNEFDKFVDEEHARRGRAARFSCGASSARGRTRRMTHATSTSSRRTRATATRRTTTTTSTPATTRWRVLGRRTATSPCGTRSWRSARYPAAGPGRRLNALASEARS